MRIRTFRPLMIAGLAAAGSLLGSPHADNAVHGQEVFTEEVEERLRQGDPGAIAPTTVRLKALSDETSYGHAAAEYAAVQQQGKYWIGIVLGELPELARKQLQLEYGLVVEDVVPDSPAAKAEFKQHDVLLRAGEKQLLKQPADILQAVEAAEETELELTVLRAGREQTIKVTPVKRPEPESTQAPAGGAQSPGTAIVPEAAIRKLEDALQQLRGKQLGEKVELVFPRPGIVAQRVEVQGNPVGVPNNLTVRITKEKGDTPAKIYVKQGDKEWEVTEDKLGDLPENLRLIVERMLGRNEMSFNYMLPRVPVAIAGPPSLTTIAPPAPPAAPTIPPIPNFIVKRYEHSATPPQVQAFRVETAEKVRSAKDPVEGKLDEVLARLERLESKSLEKLQDEVAWLRKELDELRTKE
jgi:hypothetical protein